MVIDIKVLITLWSSSRHFDFVFTRPAGQPFHIRPTVASEHLFVARIAQYELSYASSPTAQSIRRRNFARPWCKPSRHVVGHPDGKLESG